MQSRSVTATAAAPLMDLIGLPAQRARPAQGEPPFESLVGPQPQRGCGKGPEMLSPPRTVESKPADSPPKRDQAEGSEEPLPRCGNDSVDHHSAEQSGTGEPPNEAVAPADPPVGLPHETVAEESIEESAEVLAAEALLAASLAAVQVVPARAPVPEGSTAAGEVAAESEPALSASGVAMAGANIGPGATGETSTSIDAVVLSTPQTGADVTLTAYAATPADPAIASTILSEDNPTPDAPQPLTAADRAATEAVSAMADAPSVDESLAARDESGQIVDRSVDDSADRQEPEAPTETWEALELPADSQLPPVANTAAAQNDSRPSTQHNPSILPPVDASASTRQRIPEAILGSPGPATARASAESAVDSVRLLQRVARAFAAAHERGGEVRLRLRPEELGALRLEVQVRDGVMVARVEAETAAARAAIVENLPALRERLAEQGVRIERFEVDLMNQQGGNAPEHSAHGDREPITATRAVVRTAAHPESGVQPKAAAAPTGSGRLNVIV